MFCCCFFLSMEHVQFILFCFCSVRLYNRSKNMQLSGVLVFLLHYLLSFWRENGNTRRRRYRRKLMWSIFAGVSFLNQYTVVYMPCVYVQFLPYYSMRFYCIPFHSSLPPSCPPVLAESHTQIPSFFNADGKNALFIYVIVQFYCYCEWTLPLANKLKYNPH